MTLPTETPADAPAPTLVTLPGPRQPLAAPRWGGGKDVTRYLCAAAYLDREYADSLVEQVASEPHLGVAPSPACDISLVLRHAYYAMVRRHSRDLLLAVLLVLLLVFLFAGAPSLLVLLVLVMAWAVVFGFEMSTRYGRHLQSLRPGEFDLRNAPPAPNPAAEERIRALSGYADGNTTVYSGYSPFVGHGEQTDSWSFSLDLKRTGDLGEVPGGFDVRELYAHVTRRLQELTLPGLEFEERVFVDGDAVIDDRRFLPDPFGRPSAAVPPELVDQLKREPEDRARTYLAVHATGWQGDLVTSFFLRFARSDSSLLVEGVHTVLCPLRERYRMIDSLMPGPTFGEVVAQLVESVVATLIALVAAPFRAVSGFLSEFRLRRRVRRQDKRIRDLRVFDYGARLSVRQQASDSNYHRYFQKFDSAVLLRVCERRALDALVEFAEERGIDVGDLVRNQRTIVNNGIIATNGANVHGSSVASGERSWAFTEVIKETVSSVRNKI
ncbi:zinc ribbon domain-containing protein [Streptacidiphilus melanogenes]|uniref:zinc ribbon domain-containing protein n=1 Tax=Streptacidiphilus melanogenes TaxID=411235 RepID=UPI001F3A998E|nr:zinc ribbon domain-containing protein [Streptacidiphilus melanogenes]